MNGPVTSIASLRMHAFGKGEVKWRRPIGNDVILYGWSIPSLGHVARTRGVIHRNIIRRGHSGPCDVICVNVMSCVMSLGVRVC